MKNNFTIWRKIEENSNISYQFLWNPETEMARLWQKRGYRSSSPLKSLNSSRWSVTTPACLARFSVNRKESLEFNSIFISMEVAPCSPLFGFWSCASISGIRLWWRPAAASNTFPPAQCSANNPIKDILVYLFLKPKSWFNNDYYDNDKDGVTSAFICFDSPEDCCECRRPAVRRIDRPACGVWV